MTQAQTQLLAVVISVLKARVLQNLPSVLFVFVNRFDNLRINCVHESDITFVYAPYIKCGCVLGGP